MLGLQGCRVEASAVGVMWDVGTHAGEGRYHLPSRMLPQAQYRAHHLALPSELGQQDGSAGKALAIKTDRNLIPITGIHTVKGGENDFQKLSLDLPVSTHRFTQYNPCT